MGEDNFSFYNHQRRDKNSGNPINRRYVVRVNGKKSQRAKAGDDTPFDFIFINRFNEKNKSQQNQGERCGIKRVVVKRKKNIEFRHPKIHRPMIIAGNMVDIRMRTEKWSKPCANTGTKRRYDCR